MRSFCVSIAAVLFLGIMFTGCGPAEKDSDAPEIPARPSTEPITEERVFWGFEDALRGWEIPAWAASKSDYVAESVEISSDFASHGTSSMKIMCDFPGDSWTAALVEIQQYLNLSFYRVLRVDVYLPEDAPRGLNVSMILTVGENWQFVEMARTIPLVPGEWVTVNASIEPGSYDWKRVVPDEKFAQDIRKIAIRVESNQKPMYSGPIYVDNIRAGK